MQSRDFIDLVQTTWAHWMVRFQDFTDIDWEETAQSLSVILPDQRIYLFNMHTGMQQLWLSSPISGGRHFTYCAAQPTLSTHPCFENSTDLGPFYWHDTRSNEIIEMVLNAEFKEHHGIDLKLTGAIGPTLREKK
jgi:frataxin-like iron-binding protein CyaY